MTVAGILHTSNSSLPPIMNNLKRDRMAGNSSLAGSAPASKRRKLRKGTQSCWECRRRKARCTFSDATPNVCESCKHRGTDCISQESTDQPPPPGSNRYIRDRLGQVEALVGKLLNATGNHGSFDPNIVSSESQGPHRWNHGNISSGPRLPTAPPSSAIYAPATFDVNDLAHDGGSSCGTSNHVQRERPLYDGLTPTNLPPIAVTSEQDVTTPEKYDGLCRDLLTAWPSSQDLDAILSVPVETSSIIRAVTCTQTNYPVGLTIPSPEALFQLPPPGSHPVLITRKLLILATFLQGMPYSSARLLENLSSSYKEIMVRAIKVSHNLVTCNDDLVTSIEGIECIILEGLYENYAGNLRRSWLAARRAVMIAQILGLNRGAKPSSLAGAAFDPGYIWFRLIQLDRYLSLMLSLPQSSLEDRFASPEALEPRAPLERMHRLSCVAAGRILRRDPSEMYDPTITKEIDKLLRDASTTMPAQWWVPPTLSSCCGHMETISETLRFNDHVMQYHLLLQLHMPYLLISGSESGYEYNRMAAATASREILSRFVFFRTFRSAGYCRGVDILAFISSTALCLAHINDQRHCGTEDNGLYFLAHQRLSDRGILEKTLGNMKEIGCVNNDVIASRVAAILQHLLAIEEDVASGAKYAVTFTPERKGKEDIECGVKLSDDGTALKIHLPHLWMIELERESSRLEALQTTGRPCLSRVLEPRQGQDRNQAQRENDRDRTDNTPASTTWPNLRLPQHIPRDIDNDSENPRGLYNGDYEPFEFTQNAISDDWALQDMDISLLDDLIDETAGLETLS